MNVVTHTDSCYTAREGEGRQTRSCGLLAERSNRTTVAWPWFSPIARCVLSGHKEPLVRHARAVLARPIRRSG